MSPTPKISGLLPPLLHSHSFQAPLGLPCLLRRPCLPYLPQQSLPASPVFLHKDPHLGEVGLEEMEMEELDIPLPVDTKESI